MASPSEIRQTVTNQIIAALEGNLVPWRQPWSGRNGGPARHSNVSSGNRYSGINPLILELHALGLGLSSRWWGTFRQWADLGCTVKKRPDHVEPGHWSAQIVFFKPVSKTDVDQDTVEEANRGFLVLRTFNAFCLDQVEGEFADAIRKAQEGNDEARPNFEAAEQLLDAIGADKIYYGGERAFYSRPMPEGSWPNHTSGDFIQLPHRSQFNRIGSFYSTAFHEAAHLCECRLNYDYRQHGYAHGELIAEMSSCFVAAQLGVPDCDDMSNHAAYLQSWLEAMRADSSYIFRAATQASRVTDYLLSFVPESVAAD
jgi:antirestriction protein ArdC